MKAANCRHGLGFSSISAVLLLCLTLPAGLGAAEPAASTLQQRYAAQGELLVTSFASAPFPHPKRAEGHKYREQVYPAAEHYSDSSVAIFIPKGFRESGRIDFIVHFHGWKNNVDGVLRQYELIEQLADSRRNAVLVVPQGPRNAPDSFGGKLEDPGGFKRFMDEVTETLGKKSALKNKEFAIGRIILSGHSGGYQVISSILDRGGLSERVAEVWLFDALYAQTDKFLAWQDRQHGRLINLYTEHGGTKAETEQMMATLKQRGVPFFAGKEAAPGGPASSSTPPDLSTHRLLFLYTELEHNDVLHKHHSFAEFLKSSCLGAIE